MKHKTFLRLALIAILFFVICSDQAFAGKGGMDVGGGGTGVSVAGQTYLLDLYDYGLAETARVGDFADATLSTSLGRSLDCASLPCGQLSRKLVDIENVDPVLAAFALEALKALTWSFTNANLKSTDDVGATITEVVTVQIAVRQGSMVLIQADRWKEMPEVHKTALLLHEAFAALSGGKMTSPQIRRTLAAIFNSNFQSLKIETFNEVMDELPTSRTVRTRYGLLDREAEFHARTLLVDWESGQGKILNRIKALLFPELIFEFSYRAGSVEMFYRLWPVDAEKICDRRPPHSALSTLEDSVNVRLINYEAEVALMKPSEAPGAFLSWSLSKYDSVIKRLQTAKTPFKTGLDYGDVTITCSSRDRNELLQFESWGKTFHKTKTSLD